MVRLQGPLIQFQHQSHALLYSRIRICRKGFINSSPVSHIHTMSMLKCSELLRNRIIVKSDKLVSIDYSHISMQSPRRYFSSESNQEDLSFNETEPNQSSNANELSRSAVFDVASFAALWEKHLSSLKMNANTLQFPSTASPITPTSSPLPDTLEYHQEQFIQEFIQWIQNRHEHLLKFFVSCVQRLFELCFMERYSQEYMIAYQFIAFGLRFYLDHLSGSHQDKLPTISSASAMNITQENDHDNYNMNKFDSINILDAPSIQLNHIVNVKFSSLPDGQSLSSAADILSISTDNKLQLILQNAMQRLSTHIINSINKETYRKGWLGKCVVSYFTLLIDTVRLQPSLHQPQEYRNFINIFLQSGHAMLAYKLYNRNFLFINEFTLFERLVTQLLHIKRYEPISMLYFSYKRFNKRQEDDHVLDDSNHNSSRGSVTGSAGSQVTVDQEDVSGNSGNADIGNGYHSEQDTAIAYKELALKIILQLRNSPADPMVITAIMKLCKYYGLTNYMEETKTKLQNLHVEKYANMTKWRHAVTIYGKKRPQSIVLYEGLCRKQLYEQAEEVRQLCQLQAYVKPITEEMLQIQREIEIKRFFQLPLHIKENNIILVNDIHSLVTAAKAFGYTLSSPIPTLAKNPLATFIATVNNSNQSSKATYRMIVGVDTEWKSELHSTSLCSFGTSIIQISTINEIFLFDLLTLSRLDSQLKNISRDLLKNIFNDGSIIKLTWDFDSNDRLRINRIDSGYFKSIFNNMQSSINLDKFVKQEYPTISALGLSNTCEELFGKQINKSEQLSDWEIRPLLPNQRIYAALDAHILLVIFAKACIHQFHCHNKLFLKNKRIRLNKQMIQELQHLLHLYQIN